LHLFLVDSSFGGHPGRFKKQLGGSPLADCAVGQPVIKNHGIRIRINLGSMEAICIKLPPRLPAYMVGNGSAIIYGCAYHLADFSPVACADDNKNYGMLIGINLGMTHSCVGMHHGGCIETIANDQGNRITPSWVQFTEDERL
jgi:hypothetical protein